MRVTASDGPKMNRPRKAPDAGQEWSSLHRTTGAGSHLPTIARPNEYCKCRQKKSGRGQVC